MDFHPPRGPDESSRHRSFDLLGFTHVFGKVIERKDHSDGAQIWETCE